MSTRDIKTEIKELYGVDLSPSMTLYVGVSIK